MPIEVILLRYEFKKSQTIYVETKFIYKTDRENGIRIDVLIFSQVFGLNTYSMYLDLIQNLVYLTSVVVNAASNMFTTVIIKTPPNMNSL